MVVYVVLLLFDFAPDYARNMKGWILLLGVGFCYFLADIISSILQGVLEVPLFGPAALFYRIIKGRSTPLRAEFSYDHWGRNILFGIFFWSLIIVIVSVVNR
jgi:hypothetical protein